MNLFQLVIKQMRQRALGTWLTLLSVMLGVALAVAIMILRRESGALFGQKEYGYDVIIGKKGSATQLVMNTVYHLDVSPGNIPYSLYEDVKTKLQYRRYVKLVVPYMVGDSYQGIYPIVGTSPSLFGYDDDGNALPPDKVLEYRPDERYEFAEGRDFLPHKFEAVIGSDIAKKTDLKLGSTFQATHGFPQRGAKQDIHPTVWTVVGVLKPTHTANDRAVFIPFESLYTIGEHEMGMLYQMYLKQGLPPPPMNADPDSVKVYTQDPDGTFHLMLKPDAWELSALLIKARSDQAALGLMYDVNNLNEALAVSPALVMRQFFTQFLSGPTLVLLLIALLVTVVAGVGILVSIYNSVSARLREIAILRALGATRARVLLLICVESMLIGLFGGLLGLLAGHGLGAVGSFYFNRVVGQTINWYRTDSWEWLYLVVVIAIALIAGLVPALKAYRTPVATNLVAA
jgi:putative ABC transport system permease protein